MLIAIKQIAFAISCLALSGCHQAATPTSVKTETSRTQSPPGQADVENLDTTATGDQPGRVDVAYLNQQGVIDRTGHRLGEICQFDGLPIIDVLPQVGAIERIQFSTSLIVLDGSREG